MQVQFYGVRGSIPISGADITKYGGNSSCIRIQSKEGTPLILDCGTGARPAGVERTTTEVSPVPSRSPAIVEARLTAGLRLRPFLEALKLLMISRNSPRSVVTLGVSSFGFAPV